MILWYDSIMSYTKPEPLTAEEYREKAIKLALAFAPRIAQCKHCTYPVRDGYCCGTCGSDDPQGEYDE
jgi:hypothetical protein